MASPDDRNVFMEFSHVPGEVQGGLDAAPNLTQREFVDMLDIAFTAEGGNQVYHPRTLTLSVTSRDNRFRDQIRNRDRRCVISGDVIPERVIARGVWTGFEAAHVFPLTLNQLFNSFGYNDLLTHNIPPGVNSQNGILLRSDIHRYWDSYSLAINPDNGYGIQSFSEQTWQYHGRVLHPACRQQDSPFVLDPLLRWHFEQAVLPNMRFDFPPGTDMMGEIRAAPRAAERMEAELFTRLYGRHEEQPLEHDRTSQALTFSC
ncbi:HNH endonuclease [Elaphomyces granulatus]